METTIITLILALLSLLFSGMFLYQSVRVTHLGVLLIRTERVSAFRAKHLKHIDDMPDYLTMVNRIDIPLKKDCWIGKEYQELSKWKLMRFILRHPKKIRRINYEVERIV